MAKGDIGTIPAHSHEPQIAEFKYQSTNWPTLEPPWIRLM